MVQQAIDISKEYTLNEYIRIDEAGNERHEYYFGKLIAMPGESLLHNKICLRLYLILNQLLSKAGFEIFVENVKVSVNKDIYLYPDVVVMKEQPATDLPYKDYIIYSPLLIAEVLSDSNRKYDLTDKFIQYQKIASLQYYLAVEPQKNLVIFYEKDAAGEWMAKTHTDLNDMIQLPKLDVSFPVGDIYSGR